MQIRSSLCIQRAWRTYQSRQPPAPPTWPGTLHPTEVRAASTELDASCQLGSEGIDPQRPPDGIDPKPSLGGVPSAVPDPFAALWVESRADLCRGKVQLRMGVDGEAATPYRMPTMEIEHDRDGRGEGEVATSDRMQRARIEHDPDGRGGGEATTSDQMHPSDQDKNVHVNQDDEQYEFGAGHDQDAHVKQNTKQDKFDIANIHKLVGRDDSGAI